MCYNQTLIVECNGSPLYSCEVWKIEVINIRCNTRARYAAGRALQYGEIRRCVAEVPRDGFTVRYADKKCAGHVRQTRNWHALHHDSRDSVYTKVGVRPNVTWHVMTHGQKSSWLSGQPLVRAYLERTVTPESLHIDGLPVGVGASSRPDVMQLDREFNSFLEMHTGAAGRRMADEVLISGHYGPLHGAIIESRRASRSRRRPRAH
jgi:hypothetical protein